VLSGSITASSGTIGGFTIGANSLYSGSGGTRVGLDGTTGTVRFWAGSETPTLAPFNVTEAGALTAKSGAVGGFTLAANTLSSGTDADYVAMSSAGTNAFWAGDSTFADAEFSVTAAGALKTTSATITGPNLTLGTGTAYDANSALKFARTIMSAGTGNIYGVYGAESGADSTLGVANVAVPTSAANVRAITAVSAIGYKSTGAAADAAAITLQSENGLSKVTVSAATKAWVWDGSSLTLPSATHIKQTVGGADKQLIGTVNVSSVDYVKIDDDALGVLMDGTLKVAGVTHILGGSSIGITFRSNIIQTEDYPDTDGISINYGGYLNGVDQWRNFTVYDGKHGQVFGITGSTAAAWFAVDVSAASYTDRSPDGLVRDLSATVSDLQQRIAVLEQLLQQKGVRQ
jgi:hypothetical protein